MALSCNTSCARDDETTDALAKLASIQDRVWSGVLFNVIQTLLIRLEIDTTTYSSLNTKATVLTTIMAKGFNVTTTTT